MARLLSAKYRPVREIRAETEPYTHATIALAGAMFLMLNKNQGGILWEREQPALL